MKGPDPCGPGGSTGPKTTHARERCAALQLFLRHPLDQYTCHYLPEQPSFRLPEKSKKGEHKKRKGVSGSSGTAKFKGKGNGAFLTCSFCSFAENNIEIQYDVQRQSRSQQYKIYLHIKNCKNLCIPSNDGELVFSY
jgi:hypothetical protein